MQRHRLADNLTVFPSGLCLFTHNMLLLMSPYNGGGLFGGDSGGSFEGNAGIVGAVLIFALLAGLALAFLHNLLWGFGFFRGFRRHVLRRHTALRSAVLRILNAAPHGHGREIRAFPHKRKRSVILRRGL